MELSCSWKPHCRVPLSTPWSSIRFLVFASSDPTVAWDITVPLVDLKVIRKRFWNGKVFRVLGPPLYNNKVSLHLLHERFLFKLNPDFLYVTFNESVVDHRIQFAVPDIHFLVLLSGFCLYLCPPYISCVILSPFTHYLFLQTPPVRSYSLSFHPYISYPTFPFSLLILFKYNAVFGHMSMFLFETVFLN